MFDVAHHLDGCRVARLSQINADIVGRLAHRKAHHPLPHRFAKYPPCITAVMGPPDRNGERKNKIVVLAAARVERQVTGHGKLNSEILYSRTNVSASSSSRRIFSR